jgi:hypothetical protein
MRDTTIAAIATSMIAFSTSLGVLLALLQYVLPTKDASFLIIIFWSEVYILITLSFLYLFKRLSK